MSGHTAALGIVVGVDGSAASHMATRWAASEAMIRDIPLTLVRVVPAAPHDAVQFVSAAARAELQQQLESAGRKVIADAIDTVSESTEGRGPDVSGEVLNGHPVSTLVDFSREAQLVVVGRHDRGGFAGMLLGSVSTAVSQAARTPVIVARQR